MTSFAFCTKLIIIRMGRGRAWAWRERLEVGESGKWAVFCHRTQKVCVCKLRGKRGKLKIGKGQCLCLCIGPKRPPSPCVHSRCMWCMVLRVCALLTFVPSQSQVVLGKHSHPFSPTYNQQTDTGSSVRQRLRTTTTNRQRIKLAEGSQEGGKGSESEKWVTRPRGEK